MVNIIEEYLCRTEHLDIPCSLGSDFKAAAKELVVLIEDAGMLPPLNDWSFHTDGDKADADNIRYYTWESEDD